MPLFFSSRRRHTRLQGDWSSDVCSSDLEEGDQLVSMPLKISVEPIEAGAGADAAVAKVLTEETRAALASFPQFTVAQDAQLTALGRVSGTRGRRTMTVQVVDKKGNAVQKLELPGSF